jgi:hypothetical protein
MPTTIALQGEWGSGKTSLMNMLKSNLCEGDDAKFFGIWINTWEYSLMQDPTAALVNIVDSLTKNIIRFADENSTGKNLKEQVLKFGLMAFSVAINRGTDVVKEFLTDSHKSSIGEIRTELETVINSCIQKRGKQGFIFFIDDLDRIDPPVAVRLLELLKNLFTFDHCIFVLAIDYDVVIKGLEPKFGKLSEQNEREFRSFFDKIIQVPFSMPVTRYVIDEFLKESLLSIHYLSENQRDSELIGVFSEISNLSVGTNPRALKRLLNSLLLICCINPKEDETGGELELLVNFALVGIQIAFPAIYRLLTINPGFDKWDEEILTQANSLSTAVQQNEAKCDRQEKWEEVLFRLCQNDTYLKKQFPNIAKLFHLLKKIIEEKSNGETVKEMIGDMISLSSVTNLDAFDKQPLGEGIHISSFLKGLRDKLIERLKKQNAEIKHVAAHGMRVKNNAFIKFSRKKEDKDCIRLHAQFRENQIELSISATSLNLEAEKIALPSVEDFMQEDRLQEIVEITESLYKEIQRKSTKLNIEKMKMFIIRCVIASLIFVLSMYIVRELFDKKHVTPPILIEGTNNTNDVINASNMVTSFTTSSGVRVSIYNHQNTKIIIAEKNGVVSVAAK